MCLRRRLFTPYFLLLLGVVAASPLTLARGFGVFDDSVYLLHGELWKKGYLPYRDIRDNKPIGLFIISRGIAEIAGDSWYVPRLVLLAMQIASGVCLIHVARWLWDDRVAVLAVLFYVLSAPLTQAYSFHTEQFCQFFGFLAVMAWHSKAVPTVVQPILAGMLIGCAGLVKQPGLLYLAGPLVLAVVPRPTLVGIRRMLMAIIGTFLVLGTAVLGLFFLGTLPESYDCQILKALQMTTVPFQPFVTLRLVARTPSTMVALVCGLICLFTARGVKLSGGLCGELLLMVGAMTLASLYPMLRIGGALGHYMGTIVLFTSLLGGVFAHAVRVLVKSRVSAFYSKVCFSVFWLAMIAYSAAISWGCYITLAESRLFFDLEQAREICEVIKREEKANERVVCLSDAAPRLYYMCHLVPRGPYSYFWCDNDSEYNLKDAYNDALSKRSEVVVVECDASEGSVIAASRRLTRAELSALETEYRRIDLSHDYHPLRDTTTYLLIRSQRRTKATESGQDVKG